MRKLNTQDTFKALRLITKSKLKDKLTEIVKNISENGYDSLENVGIEGIMTVLETLTETSSEQLLYEVLSGPYEMTAKEVGELPLDEQIQKLSELKELSNLDSFFSVLSGLLTRKL